MVNIKEASARTMKPPGLLTLKMTKCFYVISVNPLVKPRPPSATSIPAILKALQDEWVRGCGTGNSPVQYI